MKKSMFNKLIPRNYTKLGNKCHIFFCHLFVRSTINQTHRESTSNYKVAEKKRVTYSQTGFMHTNATGENNIRTRSDILQGQALFRGVEQLLIREKKQKKRKEEKKKKGRNEK